MSKVKTIIKKWIERETRKASLVEQCAAYKRLQIAGIKND